jgi:hypothetical protein
VTIGFSEAVGGHRVQSATQRNPESSVLAQTTLDSRVHGNDGSGPAATAEPISKESLADARRKPLKAAVDRLNRATLIAPFGETTAAGNGSFYSFNVHAQGRTAFCEP